MEFFTVEGLAMKQVELVRQCVGNELRNSLNRVRLFLGRTEDNLEAIDRLAYPSKDFTELLSTLIEMTMEHCGHTTELSDGNRFSKARRIANKLSRSPSILRSAAEIE